MGCMQKFIYAVSKRFDPDRDLVRVGLANLTTMLKEKLKRLVSFAIMLSQLLFLQEVVTCVISV